MPNNISSTGFDRVRYQDLRQEKEVEFKAAFGNNIKTDVQSGFGQLISISTQAEDELASNLQLLLTAFDPNAAQGVLLSRLAIIMNKRRNPAVPSTVTVELIVDGNGAVVPVGFIVEGTAGVQFETTQQVICPPSAITSVQMQSVEEGAIIAPANTLLTVLTPVLGVIYVSNPSDASLGSEIESDAHLRARCLDTSSCRNSTAIGIQVALQEVDGVSYARVYENKNHLPVVSPNVPINQPPHSVFPVVDGGTDDDVARALATTVAAGIDYAEPADNLVGVSNIISHTYTDPISGQPHLVFWARPTLRTVYVKVTVIRGDHYPADGANRIKAEIVKWGEVNGNIGESVVASALFCPVHAVPSLQVQSLFVGLTNPAANAIASMGVADKPVILLGNISVIEI